MGPDRYAPRLSDEQIAAGAHREQVGGRWDEIGKLQSDFLIAQGLRPEHLLLDVGCGAMRGGVRFAAYLEPNHYFGIDVSDWLVRAALDVEVPRAGVQDKVPACNLHVTDRFDIPFGVDFDFAIAQSLFTHLPLNDVRLCLFKVAQVMKPGARLFATFFPVAEESPYDLPQWQVRVTTYADRDPFHYRPSELAWAAGVAEWDFSYLGGWDHPRGQHMAEFRRR